jgi:RNA polymerase sigma factor (sigma-70 family)
MPQTDERLKKRRKIMKTESRQDLENILTEEKTLQMIEKHCGKLFFDENEKDICFTFVLDALRENDFKRIREFKGRSQLKTFLYTTIYRLAIECHRKRYGKPVAPTHVKKRGKWAVYLWKLICVKRFSHEDAYEMLVIAERFNGTYLEYTEAIGEITPFRCPDYAVFYSMDTLFSKHHDEKENSGNVFPDTEQADSLEKLIQKLEGEIKRRALTILREEMEKMSEEDKVLIRNVDYYGMSIKDTAKMLGISPPAARKRRKKIFLRIKKRMLEIGVRNP